MKTVRSLLVLAAFAAIVAPALAAETAVTVSSNKYSPSVVSVAPGDTVKWTNSGGTHDITLDDDDVGEPNPPSSSAWTVTKTFPTTGSFRYYCSVHGAPNGIGMSGTVVVSEPGSEPPSTAPPAPTPVTDPPDDQGVVAFSVTLEIKKLRRNSRGTLFKFSGRASPEAPGAKAQIQRRGKGRKFRTVATTLLKGSEAAKSTYSKMLRLRKSGVYRVRVPKVGDVRTGLSPKRRAAVK